MGLHGDVWNATSNIVFEVCPFGHQTWASWKIKTWLMVSRYWAVEMTSILLGRVKTTNQMRFNWGQSQQKGFMDETLFFNQQKLDLQNWKQRKMREKWRERLKLANLLRTVAYLWSLKLRNIDKNLTRWDWRVQRIRIKNMPIKACMTC